MQSNPFIERAIRDFNSRHPDFIGAHDARLSSILEQIQELPSPLKEERLVELIVSPTEEALEPAQRTEARERGEASPRP